MKWYETIIQTIQDCINNSSQGLVSDPEYNFSAMRENAIFSESTHQAMYQKTGKNIDIPHISKPLRLLIYIDNNQNFSERYKKNPQLINQIQYEFQNDVELELSWGSDLIDLSKTSDYFSYLEELLIQTKQQIQLGNIVVLISDFLEYVDWADWSQEVLEKLDPDHFIALQISLPIFSQFYHQFYVKDFEKPQIEHWFQV